MSEGLKTNANDIDLFDVFETLWDGKWLITACLLMALLVTGIYVYVKDPVFESRLRHSFSLIPPGFELESTWHDYERKFRSGSVFRDWKTSFSDSAISERDIEAVELWNGYVFSSDREGMVTRFDFSGPSIVLASNNPQLLNNVFEYANYVNGVFTEEMSSVVREDLGALRDKLNSLQKTSRMLNMVTFVSNLAQYENWLSRAEKGQKVFDISPPEIPRRLSPSPPKLCFLAAFLGLSAGVVVVLIKKAFLQRKERLGKL